MKAKSPQPILVFGRSGQVGRALETLLGPKAIFLSRAEANFELPPSLASVIDKYSPQAVVNAAAYTKVEQAEKEEALATLVNGQAPGALARACAAKGIPFLHISTDYVFGNSRDPMLARQENDPTGPLNAYGRSKLEGERQVLAASGRNIILRTSWVYDAEGVNFLNTMLRLGREKETLNVVSDQFGAPTYANDLAEGIQQILSLWLDKGSNAEGIYHLTNAGSVSWHGFAEAIFNHASQFESLKIKDLRAVSSTEYPSAIKRPLNSRLDCHKAEVELGVKLRSWEAALGACLKQKYLNKLS